MKALRSDRLMIGDWVNIYKFPNNNPQEKDLFAAKVVSIMHGLPNENLDTVECIIPKEGGGYGVASRPCDTCLPIPLTAEILEKNGFKFNELPFILGWEQFGLTLYLAANGYCINCGQNIALNVDNVHELQHVLRLCGIEKEIELC